MFRDKEEWQKLTISVIDILAVIISGYLSSLMPYSDLSLSSLPILVLMHFLVFYMSNYYEKFNSRGYLDDAFATFKYSFFLLVSTTFVSFMLENQFIISRRGVVYFVVINFILIFIINFLVKSYRNHLYPNTISSKKIYLLTTVKRFESMQQFTKGKFSQFDGSVVAVTFIDDSNYKFDDSIHVVPINAIEDYIVKSVVDQLFIDIPSDMFNAKDIISLSESVGIPTSIKINSIDHSIVGQKRFQTLFGYEVITVSSNFYKYSHLLLKRMLDIIGSLIGLLICGIVAIFVVPQIKKDGGPAFFSQDRVGKNGRVFKFYKFRSMRVDAEEIKKELMQHNQMEGLMFKMDDDPRITKIGKFIRKTSIDELPQFWNVLIGDMSLVGTRPPTIDEYEKYTLEHKRRLSFNPGITGLWQVSGRSDIRDFNEIVKLDVDYINSWTIWSDIKILIKTIAVVLKREGSK